MPEEGTRRISCGVRRFLGLIGLLAVAACNESAPLVVVGEQYELTSYGGGPLPHTWQVIATTQPNGTPGNCNDEIAGGSLLFESNGGVTAVIDRNMVCDGQPDQHSVDTAIGQYVVSGSQLDMTLLGALADLPGVGPYTVSAELVGDEIRVTQTVTQTNLGPVTNRTAKIFRKVR